jgi:pSer/pThr/pTyr-binding forkhead associated (FHA) protein
VPVLFLNILKLLFLALIFVFLWQIARSIGAHIGAGGSLPRPKGGAEVVVVRSEHHAGERFGVRDVVVVGRSPDADVIIDDPYASEFHLRMSSHDGQLLLQDLGSTNGTYVNGRRVTMPLPLNKGDAVQVGKTIMEVR